MLFHLHCMGQSCICPSASEITLKDISRKNLYQYTTMYNNSWMVCMYLHMNFSMAYCLHKMKPSIIMPNPYCVWTLNINLCEIQRENYMSVWASVLEICASLPGWQLWRIKNDFSSILCLWFEIRGMRTYNFFDWISNTGEQSVISVHALIHLWWWSDFAIVFVIFLLFTTGNFLKTSSLSSICIWVGSRNWDCLVTWFCYQLIAKPGNKTAPVSLPDPYVFFFVITLFVILCA